MRAATVVQVLQNLFYVLLHVLFYLWSPLNCMHVKNKKRITDREGTCSNGWSRSRQCRLDERRTGIRLGTSWWVVQWTVPATWPQTCHSRTTPAWTDSASVSQYYYTHSTPRYIKVHSDNTRVYRQCISLTVLLHTQYTQVRQGTLGQHPGVPTVYQSYSITTHSTSGYIKVHSDNIRVYRQCISLTVLLHTVHPGTSRYTRTTPGCTNSETFKSQQSKTRHRYHGTIFTWAHLNGALGWV